MQELSNYAYDRDRSEFNLGDTLDIKTGLILTSLTFLAIQSAALLFHPVSLWQTLAQILSVASLIAGGTFSAAELWPRDYEREATPDKYVAWIAEVENHHKAHPEAEPMNEERLRSARLKAATERVLFNSSVNKRKSRLMFLAFYCALIAFAVNMITMTMRLF